ncbi:MAG TPA: hypothetical protein VGD98_13435 [Ktedonobacteraceae bacterium]
MAIFKLFRKRQPLADMADGSEATAPRVSVVTLAGRRHVAGIPYALPKDLVEVHRLDFQHSSVRKRSPVVIKVLEGWSLSAQLALPS